MDIFVGSLSFKLKESELREAFEKFGKVSSAKIIIDKITRQSKGFGFVEMPDESEARMAISALNGADMYGRALVVNESQKREPRSGGPAGGGGSGDRYQPRTDFKKEGYNRPRPTDGASTDSRSSYIPRERSAPSSDEDDSTDAPSTFGSSDFSVDKPRTSEKKFSGGGHDKSRSGGYGDRGGHSKSRSDSNRPGKPGLEEHRRGGGGSKSYKNRDTGDDDWY